MTSTTEPTQHHVRVGDIDLVYLAAGGSGPLAVCLHGFPDTAHTWTHLLPATFDGAARFNVANALAAAGAAFAAGAPLHDIRQGLRTFTTNYYLSPGRMNLIQVPTINGLVDFTLPVKMGTKHPVLNVFKIRIAAGQWFKTEAGAAWPYDLVLCYANGPEIPTPAKLQPIAYS